MKKVLMAAAMLAALFVAAPAVAHDHDEEASAAACSVNMQVDANVRFVKENMPDATMKVYDKVQVQALVKAFEAQFGPAPDAITNSDQALILTQEGSEVAVVGFATDGCLHFVRRFPAAQVQAIIDAAFPKS